MPSTSLEAFFMDDNREKILTLASASVFRRNILLSGISVQPQPDEDHCPDPSWYHPSRPVLRRLFAVLHGQLLSMKILRSHCDPGWQGGAFLSSRSQKGSFSVRVQRGCVIQTKLGQPRGAGRRCQSESLLIFHFQYVSFQ